MGIIQCTGADGEPFAIVVCAKSGSTSLRYVFEKWANPGQYIVHRGAAPGEKFLTKLNGWALDLRFSHANYHYRGRAWGFVRNPWKRITSRYMEKTQRDSSTKPWDRYVDSICFEGSSSPFAKNRQSDVVKGIPWPRLFDIEDLDGALDVIGRVVGAKFKAEHVRRNLYDWREPYRKHPETMHIIRNFFDIDWRLGFDWEPPLL